MREERVSTSAAKSALRQEDAAGMNEDSLSAAHRERTTCCNEHASIRASLARAASICEEIMEVLRPF